MARNKVGLSDSCVIKDYVKVREDTEVPTVKITTSQVRGAIVVRAATDIIIDAKVFI